jgi:hypothetical protein
MLILKLESGSLPRVIAPLLSLLAAGEFTGEGLSRPARSKGSSVGGLVISSSSPSWRQPSNEWEDIIAEGREIRTHLTDDVKLAQISNDELKIYYKKPSKQQLKTIKLRSCSELVKR